MTTIPGTARFDASLRRLSTVNPAAIVLGNGSSNDLSILRTFHRRGIPAIHLVGDRQLGSFSRCGVRLRLPSVEREPQTWLQVLQSTAAQLPLPPVLFPCSDPHIAFISRHSEHLQMCRFILPDAPVVECILNKQEQYQAAQAAGIRVPQTYYPETQQDILALAPALQYPVILKPYTAHLGRPKISNRKVIVVESADELISALTQFASSDTRFMIQKIVAGRDDAIFWYGGYWNQKGNEQAGFVVQKLRQNPPGFGDGSFQRTVDDPEIASASRRLLAALHYRGPVMVEFKRDLHDRTCNLIEINPRTVTGNQLAIRAGIDLAWLQYLDLTAPDKFAAPSPPSPQAQLNIKFVNEEFDVQSFAAMFRSGDLTFAQWIRSIWGTQAWAFLAWDDPLPLLVGLWRFFWLGLLRRTRPSRDASSA